MVVDCPWAAIGAAWVDLLLLPSVRVQGGPQPELLFGRHPVARGVAPTAVLAALAGYLVRESRQPPRLGDPACAPSSRTTVGRRQGIPSSSRSANPDPAGGGRTREPARCC
jgi:hypothetical protein